MRRSGISSAGHAARRAARQQIQAREHHQMKLCYFNDYKLGVLKGDNTVVDVSAVVQDIPHTGPGDLMNGLIERFDQYRPKIEAGKGAQAMDAAFRDVLYQAKLDVQDGRAPRLRTGRWGHNADLVVFIAGYEQGYREYSEARSGKLAEPSAAELAGYCDGTLDGAADRIKAQPFQVEKTANYRNAGQGFLEAKAHPEEYMRFYRQAYSNGYQQGYYLQQQ